MPRDPFTHPMGGRSQQKPPRLSEPESEGEATLAQHLRAFGLPTPERQLLFAADHGRRWRFDFAWPDRMLAVEIVGKPHTIKERFAADCDRELAAFALGWTVIRFSPGQVRSGLAARFLVEVFAGRPPIGPLALVGILTVPAEGSTVPRTPPRPQRGPRSPELRRGGRR